MIKLEICAYDLQSCLIAERAGAHRIELCSSQPEGGVTPSYAKVALAKQRVGIPIFPIIRPRSGDFVYSELELEEMLEDIKRFAELGVEGFVTGVLTPLGELDRVANQLLIDAAGGRPVTLHRVFDMSRCLEESLELAIELGFSRVLTSGGYQKATEGADVIARLVRQAKDRIIIMAGSGVSPNNAAQLVKSTGVRELHGSLQYSKPSTMVFKNDRISMGGVCDVDEFTIRETDPEKVRKLLQAVEGL